MSSVLVSLLVFLKPLLEKSNHVIDSLKTRVEGGSVDVSLSDITRHPKKCYHRNTSLLWNLFRFIFLMSVYAETFLLKGSICYCKGQNTYYINHNWPLFQSMVSSEFAFSLYHKCSCFKAYLLLTFLHKLLMHLKINFVKSHSRKMPRSPLLNAYFPI